MDFYQISQIFSDVCLFRKEKISSDIGNPHFITFYVMGILLQVCGNPVLCVPVVDGSLRVRSILYVFACAALVIEYVFCNLACLNFLRRFHSSCVLKHVSHAISFCFTGKFFVYLGES